MKFTPEKIYLDNRAQGYPLTEHILKQYASVPVHMVDDTKTLIKEYQKKEGAISAGKKVLLLTIHKGKFLKKCPGTKNYLCCGYQILHQASQCSLDCSYCILQSYFNNPMITLFVNLEEMYAELDSRLDRNPERLWRIGTGEFTDSLVFDNITNLTSGLIPYFISKKNAVLELKTKTTNIENLLCVQPKGKIVIAWSLNAMPITQSEEKHATGIEARIKAAETCQKHGYKIAFHFDPLLYYPTWKEDYAKTVALIYQHISPASIAWISMGCFRFIPSLKAIIEERFPHSTIPYNEFVRGDDGKMRYIKPLRIHMYTFMHTTIKKHDPNAFVYLCMESSDVWQQAFGYTPRRFGSLAKGLDNRVFAP